MDFRRLLPEIRWQSRLSPVFGTGSPDWFFDPVATTLGQADPEGTPDNLPHNGKRCRLRWTGGPRGYPGLSYGAHAGIT